jgi:phosphopantothenoylcysteine decarboxylase/phosphopantothenate--cysteine ligase
MKKRNIVIGVTGGIAAYKALEVISKLRYLLYDTFVIMTENAQKFVCPLSFETLSKNPVVTNMFSDKKSWEVEHISLARKADAFVT